jgi:CRP/FNR family transcriptional regulator, cyclic AMP receptor protein
MTAAVLTPPLRSDARPERGGATNRARSSRAVPLTTLDAAFHAAVPSAQRRHAQRFTADVHVLSPGRWETREADAPRAFGALVLAGLVRQEVVLAGRQSAELLGPGDVVRPWRSDDPTIPCHMRWTCIDAVSVAILDDRFLAAARRWPGLMTVIFERLTDQLHNAQRRTAIIALPRVEQRLLALFWQLADRWGVVRPEGVVIRLKLTHGFLGDLIAAKRPTVSLALAGLAADNLLTRGGVAHWTLAHHSVDPLQSGLATSPPSSVPLSTASTCSSFQTPRHTSR